MAASTASQNAAILGQGSSPRGTYMICPVELANEMSAFLEPLEVGMFAGGWHDVLPESAVERTMKIQEVILRAMAKKITWGVPPNRWLRFHR